ncbi:hypothetical protein KOI35_14815 [Actinoplanes bogorensis]|uniref:Uncharacterized protein n=1 Tax=Paractinoplanes bogorensis TaxID=1610840 RepID=A0ABS5YN82_9ACTN|nr:hypothetical protein [Actinoplanes bogorensis]MBU2664771.1 hypothetical protein [Actinoplanes bogorensis]
MRPSRTRPWLWAAVALVLIAGVALVTSYGKSSDVEDTGVKSGSFGTPVTRDGLLEYTLSAPICTATACTAGITVHNVSDVARKPGIAFATAYDARGAEHLIDAVAEIRGNTALLDDLAPGAQITDRLIYAMPAISSLLLRETPGSPGISFAVAG